MWQSIKATVPTPAKMIKHTVDNVLKETDKDPTRARALYTTGKPSGNNHSQLRKYNGDKVQKLTPFHVPQSTGIIAIYNNNLKVKGCSW